MRFFKGQMLMFLMLFSVMVGLGALPGCKTDPETGERVKAAAPSPPEARLIAHGIMRLAIAEIKMKPEKLVLIKDIMQDSKAVLLTGLKKDPTNLDAIRMSYLSNKNPEMGTLANTVLQVLVYRLRPLIDQGKTDLAGQYIESVIEGAVSAIEASSA